MARKPTISQQRQIEALISKLQPELEAAFREGMQKALRAVDVKAFVQALDANDLEAALRLVQLDPSHFTALLEIQRAGFITAGSIAADNLPAAISGAFSFNGRHPEAERIIARLGADLITNVTGPAMREAARDAILAGLASNTPKRQIMQQLVGARSRVTGERIGGILGLDQPRIARADRVRAILSDPEQIADYFKPDGSPRFVTTNRRFDPMIRRAIKEGRALPPADLERVTTQHKARLLADRGKAIALNESFTAQAMGRNEAYRQLIAKGDVISVEKRWQHASLNDPRPDHIRLNGETVAFDQAFMMDDGTALQYPHDPAGGARHSLGCRCSVIYIPKYRRD